MAQRNIDEVRGEVAITRGDVYMDYGAEWHVRSPSGVETPVDRLADNPLIPESLFQRSAFKESISDGGTAASGSRTRLVACVCVFLVV